ncbi:MAG TPA: hypothetical protein VFM93_13480 [Candidatus Limnocylindria bacterium]|nr:hypothetical protein [Candidatus Limnocylindria bacterium]
MDPSVVAFLVSILVLGAVLGGTYAARVMLDAARHPRDRGR